MKKNPSSETFGESQRFLFSREARHLAGKASALVSCRTNGISVQKAREILNDIYLMADDLVDLLDKFEKEKKS